MDQYSSMGGMFPPQDYPHRSPSSTRGYNGNSTLTRQASRHFQQPYDSQVLYNEGHAQARFDSEPRFENRMANPSMTTHLPSHFTNTYGDYANQTWSHGGLNQGAGSLGGTSRMRPQARRTPLPSPWMDNQHIPHMPGMPNFQQSNGQHQPTAHSLEGSDEQEANIPTAIVIKNIPFAVKKEQLLELMQQLNLPLPYAFNYHFDSGVFRGLAFANFTTAPETEEVINALNHMELHGRRLRVEFKRMLPAADRERIEREKRERRGQLQEQHQPMARNHTVHNQASMSPLHSSSPSPFLGVRESRPITVDEAIRSRLPFQHTSATNCSIIPSSNASGTVIPSLSLLILNGVAGQNDGFYVNGLHRSSTLSISRPPAQTLTKTGGDLDMNDPSSRDYYSQLLLFKADPTRSELHFDESMEPTERRKVHTLAHYMGLEHVSSNVGEKRVLSIVKPNNRPVAAVQAPQTQSSNFFAGESQRRGLNRAATIDFSETRANEGYTNNNNNNNHTLARQSSGLLDIPGSPSAVYNLNLRGAKSFADLRTQNTSPVPSTASFPANLTHNLSRFAEYSQNNGSATSGTPNLTPTSAGGPNRDDYSISGLINGVSGLGFNTERPIYRTNGSNATIRPIERENHAGPIGSQRPTNGTYEESQRNGLPTIDRAERQPRGPGSEWGQGQGFSSRRQNGHANRNSGDSSDRSSDAAVRHF